VFNNQKRRFPAGQYRHHVPREGSGSNGIRYAIEISYSDTEGKSWTEYVKTPGGRDVIHGPVGMWEPFLWPPVAAEPRRDPPGGDAIWCAYSAEITNGGRQNIVWQKSLTQGRTWSSAPQMISYGPDHDSRDGMPGITRLADGSLLVVFEGFWEWDAHNSTQQHHFSVQARRSFTNGASWTGGEVIFSPPKTAKGINAGAPQVVTSPSTGEVFVSFMTDEDVGTDPGPWIPNAQVKVMRGGLKPGGGAGPGGRWQELEFDVASRFLVSPAAVPTMWAGLNVFDNQSWVLYGHAGLSHAVGPLEAATVAPSESPHPSAAVTTVSSIKAN
jgi:hypothetical protein